MKSKKLFALIAALLCLSMLFVSCKKQPEEPIDTDAPAAPEHKEPGMETIFNLDWQSPASESNVYTKVSELNVESLPDSYNISTNRYASLLIYRDSSSRNVLRVYDYAAEKELLALTDSDSNDGTNYTYVRNYLCIPSDKSIAVLTVTHRSANQYSFTSNNFETSNFRPYLNNNESISGYTAIHDYEIDSQQDATTDYEIKVYNTADMTAPAKTVNSNTVKSWLDYNDFDSSFYKSVLKGIQLNVKYFNEGSYTTLASDLILKDGNIYRFDNDGNMTLVREIGLNDVKTDGQHYIKRESYYYYNKTITVYDQNIMPVSAYSAPSYANDVNFYVMQNGNIFVQYTVLLDENSETYDYLLVSRNNYGIINQKYDLVTLVVSAADGKATEIAANYKIVPGTYSTNSPFTPSNAHFISTYTTNPDYIGYYNPEICNIATVNYIKDRRLDTSLVTRDIVSVNNKGEIVKSLKLHDEWAAIPENLGNGYFTVENVYGTTTVMDKTGKILSSNINYNNVPDKLSDFYILRNGIYDLSGNKVYDLTDKTFTHEVLHRYKNTVLLNVLSDNGIYKVILFNNGKVTELGTTNAVNYGEYNREDVTLLSAFATPCGYELDSYDAATGKYAYNYYNVEGTLLLTTEDSITSIASTDKVALYYGTKMVDNVQTTVIYKFS